MLHLVTKNRIDIHDIPIHEITEQYLAYLRRAQAFDLELASSFFAMASTLIFIKSRMLLPKRRQEAATVAGRECAPEHAKLVQDFLDMTERQVSHQLDRLEAVETLYRIETGTRLGLLAELAEEGQDDSDF